MMCRETGQRPFAVNSCPHGLWCCRSQHARQTRFFDSTSTSRFLTFQQPDVSSSMSPYFSGAWSQRFITKASPPSSEHQNNKVQNGPNQPCAANWCAAKNATSLPSRSGCSDAAMPGNSLLMYQVPVLTDDKNVQTVDKVATLRPCAS